MAGGQPHDRAARQPCRGRVRLSCRRARLPALRELNAPPADSAAGDDLFPGSCGVLWPASLRCCRAPPADLSQTALPPAGRPGVPAFSGSRWLPLSAERPVSEPGSTADGATAGRRRGSACGCGI